MKIDRHLIPNCSEYTISLYSLSQESIDRIKELENDLHDLKIWAAAEKKKLPAEPDFMDKSDAWKTWCESDVVKTWQKTLEERWDVLKDKYKAEVADYETKAKMLEDIFATTIHGFHWIDEHTLDIHGYLNEDALIAWLEQIAKVTKMIVRNE